MVRQTITCDHCKEEIKDTLSGWAVLSNPAWQDRQFAKHAHKVHLTLVPLSTENTTPDSGYQHHCSQSCALQFVNRWMTDLRDGKI